MEKEQVLGRAAVPKNSTFTMVERKAHHAWAKLILDNPTAARLMHLLVGSMGPQNAIVISQATLAKLMKTHKRTVQRAVAALVDDNWIQRIKVGGTVNGYVVNDQVAWCEKLVMKQYSAFSAAVIVDRDAQEPEDLKPRQLRRLPLIYPPDEVMLLTGEPAPGQASLPGMEPVIEGKRDIHIPDQNHDPRQTTIHDYIKGN